MKQNLNSLCSQPEGNKWHHGSISYIGISIMFVPEFEKNLGQMYPVELEIKDATESNTSASYQDLLLKIGREGQHMLPFMTNVTISISISQIIRT